MILISEKEVRSKQDTVLQLIEQGKTVAAAMKAVKRSPATYKSWRAKNLYGFGDRLRAMKAKREDNAVHPDEDTGELPQLSFPEFCERLLNKPLPAHHLRTWEILNNREPEDLHPSMTLVWGTGRYTGGDEDDNVQHMILNFPPDHAKSTVWTVEYTLYALVFNPRYRVAIMCESEDLARKFLRQVKHYLVSPELYPELHKYAPPGGWKPIDKGEGLPWRGNALMLANNDSPEKEANVEAFGMKTKIYGSRFDRIILDDIASYRSADQYESQAELIGQDVYSRVDKEHGEILVVGTRVGAMDIYRYLRENSVDIDDKPLYTYFSQPAILENEFGPTETWKVLWPQRLSPARIARARAQMGKKHRNRFAFVYQQRDVPEENIFHPVGVDASINRQRLKGLIDGSVPGCRDAGMAGLFVLCMWDPAASAGYNAMIAYAVDFKTKKRYVLDVWIKTGVLPVTSTRQFKEWTKKYKPQVWVIEKNGIQEYITQNPELRDFARENGCRIVSHETRGNKYDAEWGVESLLAPLFYSCMDMTDLEPKAAPRADHLIEMPHPKSCPDVQVLCEQLKLWEPKTRNLVQDGVMALWFGELYISKKLRNNRPREHYAQTKFNSRRSLGSRYVKRVTMFGG